VRFLYVDEAGCTGVLPDASSPIQPLLVISGLIVDHGQLRGFTHEFIQLKRRFFSGNHATFAPFLDHIRNEVKGADLRKAVRTGSRRSRRAAIGFLDAFLEILHRRETRLLSRVWVKGVGAQFSGRAVYTFSVQSLCEGFQWYLHEKDDHGVVIADPRYKAVNSSVAHSVFTQKYSTSGDKLPRLLEMPVFGHAENHACVQAADLLCSALLFPMATYAYCLGHVANTHVSEQYAILTERYGETIRSLQFRYRDMGRWKGGVSVSDPISRRGAGHMFKRK